MLRIGPTGETLGTSSEPLPEDQFFNETLSGPAKNQKRHPIRRKKLALLPDPVELLVINALYGNGDIRCSEIVDRISQMTAGTVNLPHRSVWHALRQLIVQRRVEARRDESATKGKTPVYRLRYGGGSHLIKENSRWMQIGPAITRVAESK